MAERLPEWAAEWLEGITARKRRMIRKLSKRETAEKWKKRATSEAAEKDYEEGVKRAIEKRLRKKRLEEVSATEWQERVISGLTSWTPSAQDAIKFHSKAEPYINFVRKVKEKFDEIKDKYGYPRGPDAAKWWAENILPLLEEAKADPDFLPEAEKIAFERLAALEKQVAAAARA